MRALLLLVWRYLAYHRFRTGILVLCIGLVFFLPVTVAVMVSHFEEVLAARAESTPLLVGAKGSRYDLLIHSLYFKGKITDELRMAEYEALKESGLALAVPLCSQHTAQGFPLIGTTLDYFKQQGLSVAEGTLPMMLGDAVLGAGVAGKLDLGPGDRMLTDSDKLYDLASSYPLRMRITGVLEKSHGPDDLAVFVDLKTTWIVSGIGHGHMDVVLEADPDTVLLRTDDNVAANDSLMKFMVITPENIGSFHFHGERADFPLSAILVWPKSSKASTILKGRYLVSKTAQMLVPTKVVDELMGFIFRIKRFFDANAVVVGLATGLFLLLIVMLSLQIRKREMETLKKIGCDRWTVARLQGVEILLILATGMVLAALLSGGVYAWVVYGMLLV